MPTPHNAKEVANYFLDLGERDVIAISPMKIQKLVYYAHGWHLALKDEPLIDEQVECWPYGPVVDSLFHAFKHYGSGSIESPAIKFHFEADPSPRTWQTVPRINTEEDRFTGEFLDEIWGIYREYSAIKLSNMTHETGGPWDRVYQRCNRQPPKGTDIPTPVIKRHFKALLDSGD